MNSKRNAVLIFAIAITLAACVLVYHTIALRDLPLSALEIFAIGVPPLIFLASLPILLRPLFMGLRKPQSQTMSAVDLGLMIGAMVAGNALVFIGLYSSHFWMMVAGALIFPMFSMLRGQSREKGMNRGQFSLRRLFFIITFCAVVIGVMLAIDHWYQNAQRQNNEEWLRNSRAIWENARGKLSPGVYEQKMKELDDEAAERGLK